MTKKIHEALHSQNGDAQLVCWRKMRKNETAAICKICHCKYFRIAMSDHFTLAAQHFRAETIACFINNLTIRMDSNGNDCETRALEKLQIIQLCRWRSDLASWQRFLRKNHQRQQFVAFPGF